MKFTLPTVAATLLVGLMACQSTSPTTVKSPESSVAKAPTTSAASLPGKGVKVRPGTGAIFFGRFVAEILDIGLEKLGYTTEEVQEINPTLMHLSLGKGDLDFSPIHLDKAHAGFFKKAGGEEKLEKLGVIVPQLFEGYLIDKKTAQQYNITKLEQLKDPKIAKLFDANGNGKANLAGCEAGRACERSIDENLQAYGLTDTIEQDKGTPEVLLPDVMARYKQGKPILYYGFSPSLFDLELKPEEDTVWLEVPSASSPEGQKKTTNKETSTDGNKRGVIANKVQIVANKRFLEANPTAKRWFEVFRISNEELLAEGKLIHKGENRPQDIRRHAEEWVKNHQQQVDSWLEEARKAAK